MVLKTEAEKEVLSPEKHPDRLTHMRPMETVVGTEPESWWYWSGDQSTMEAKEECLPAAQPLLGWIHSLFQYRWAAHSSRSNAEKA